LKKPKTSTKTPKGPDSTKSPKQAAISSQASKPKKPIKIKPGYTTQNLTNKMPKAKQTFKKNPNFNPASHQQNPPNQSQLSQTKPI
jgi:hypothetical protein